MPNTLAEYYKSKGLNLPGIKDRAKTYESLGLGSALGYRGTTDQNVNLLNRLKSMSSSAPATPKPAIPTSTAPANPSITDPNKINVNGENYPTYSSLFDQMKKSLGLDTLLDRIKTGIGSSPKKSDIYKAELADANVDKNKSELDSLNSRIANIDTSLSESDKDIRNRINQSGGIVTESQVQRLAAAETEPLLNQYKNLLGARDLLESRVKSSEQRAKEMAEMKYDDAVKPLTELSDQYDLLSGVMTKNYDVAEKDLTKRIELAKEKATNRKADVISTQTDENGVVSIITREADGGFKINSVGKVGKATKKTGGTTDTGNTNDVETYAVEAINNPDFNINNVPQKIRGKVIARKNDILNEANSGNQPQQQPLAETTPITVEQFGSGIKDVFTKALPNAYKKNWQYTKDFFKGLFRK